jgi:hypothetical protein
MQVRLTPRLRASTVAIARCSDGAPLAKAHRDLKSFPCGATLDETGRPSHWLQAHHKNRCGTIRGRRVYRPTLEK